MMSLPSFPRLNVSTPINYLADIAPTIPAYLPPLQPLQELLRPIEQDFFRALFFQLMSKTKITKLKPSDFVRLSDDLYAKMRDDGVIELYELT